MKTSKLQKRVLSMTIVLAILITSLSAGLSYTFAAGDPAPTSIAREVGTESVYDKVDISKLTGEGKNPPELTGTASALGREKEWYEYLVYSEKPVGNYQINANKRMLFFDPYDYSNALVMGIDGSISELTTANTLAIEYATVQDVFFSYTTGNEMSKSVGSESNYEEYSSTTNVGNVTTKTWTDAYQYTSKQAAGTLTQTGQTKEDGGKSSWGNETTVTMGASIGVPGAEATIETGVSSIENFTADSIIKYDLTTDIKTGDITIEMPKVAGGSTVDPHDEITNGISSSFSNKFEQTTGVSASASNSWTTSQSSKVTHTYNATYFNASGSPLPWKLIHYAVFMPLRYDIQYKVDGEWITVASDYCLLTTLQGICRSWMDNNVAYYEHWGTGERVTWNEFWDTFFTTDQLKAAYENKLYPDSVS